MCEYCNLENFWENKYDNRLEGPGFKGEDGGDPPATLMKGQRGWKLEATDGGWESGVTTVYFCPWCGRELND